MLDIITYKLPTHIITIPVQWYNFLPQFRNIRHFIGIFIISKIINNIFLALLNT